MTVIETFSFNRLNLENSHFSDILAFLSDFGGAAA